MLCLSNLPKKDLRQTKHVDTLRLKVMDPGSNPGTSTSLRQSILILSGYGWRASKSTKTNYKKRRLSAVADNMQ